MEKILALARKRRYSLIRFYGCSLSYYIVNKGRVLIWPQLSVLLVDLLLNTKNVKILEKRPSQMNITSYFIVFVKIIENTC